MQHAIGTAIYCAWLGGFPPSQTSESESSSPAEIGRLLTLEEVGTIFSGKAFSLILSLSLAIYLVA